ncbi:dehydrogenase [Mycena maculata]|uniref:Dehydrogenase n=1 Tax=Mycena maculata TaxID=230809 RepID=A0AAD7J992_9AGAR|nr:dehydrogenase [Mycena maculata]
MKAVVSTGDGGIALKTVAKPRPGPTQVLIKIFAAAQNPPDHMKLGRRTEGVISEQDFAGRMEALGAEVPTRLRYVGERVAGFLNGGVDEEMGGAFGEYCVADAHVLISLPESSNYEDAPGLGLAAFTAAQALWISLEPGLPTLTVPAATPFPLMTSTDSGLGWKLGGRTVHIQLARLSGMEVITTASSRNHALVKGLGADVVLDYRDPEVSTKIRAHTGNKLAHAVDCISDATTTRQVADTIGEGGGFVALVLGEPVDVPGVHAQFSLVYTLLGKASECPMPYAADPNHYEFGKTTAILFTDLLHNGKLKTTPVKLVPNGLNDLGNGLNT